MTLSYQPVKLKAPLTQRINFRLIIFSAVVLFLIGYPLYIYLHEEITGGIQDAGNGYTAVDLRAMSLFSFDQYNGRLEDVPSKWRDLNGKKVILSGEMWVPNNAGPEARAFDLCY